MLTGEVQQKIDGRWRAVLTAGGIPVDDRRRRPAEPEPFIGPEDLVGELMTRYARGWHG